jgi:MerR family transcriptional regulator, light-induced transcriptional regulator
MMAEVTDFAAMRDQYLQRQLLGDRRAALQFVDEALSSGASVDQVRYQIVQGAQREIGRLWLEDQITIAQEHMATAISQLVLAHLFQRSSFRPRVQRKILIACVPGEHHEFPGRMLADALDVAGYDVRFLGADVPVDSLLTALEAESPQVLALSVTMLFHLSALRAAVAAVREHWHRPLKIAVGGSLFAASPELARDIGADLMAADAEQFIALLNAELGVAA